MAYKLVIRRLFFTNTDCYKRAPIQDQVGVQVHCTKSGNPYLKRYVQPNDGLLGKNRYNNSHNRPGLTVCANAYIGKLDDGTVAIYQALPWMQRCWLSGSGSKGSKQNANKLGYIGFEVCCLLSDKDYFYDAVMDKAVKLVAYLCQTLGIDPDDKTVCGKAVMDHSELHRNGHANNHADITNWLKVYGLNMNDFRNEVKKVLKEGIKVEYVDAKPEDGGRRMLKKGDVGEDVKELQKLLGIDVDGAFGMETKRAVQKFQKDHGLTADGIVGPKTWAELLKDEPDVEPDDDVKKAWKRASDKLEELKKAFDELKKFIDKMSNE